MVPYNPSDPVQQTFLKGLSLGESGNRPWEQSLYLGVGGIDLSNRPVNQYGFPLWSGHGRPVSHAAGPWQFEPATWAGLAQLAGLNFANIQDQAKGAWLLAQQVFHANTGDDLFTALKAKRYLTAQGALSKTWTSVTGNGASPGLAKYLMINGV